MPKIVINEIDRTVAGVSTYRNFSVVVPGFAANGKNPFNADHIYECSSAADFEENIGLTDEQQAVEAVAAKLIDYRILPEYEPEEIQTQADENESASTGTADDAPVYKVELSQTEFWQTYKKYNKYTLAEAGTEATIGRLVTKIDNKLYNCTLATEWTADTEYALIAEGMEGVDAREAAWHYGNQIAYNLLTLGYTVLYMDMAAYSADSANAFFEVLTDKANYDFRYLISGYIGENSDTALALQSMNSAIQQVAATRGDCIALCEIPQYVYSNSEITTRTQVINAIANAAGSGDKYSAWFAPTVEYKSGAVDSAHSNSSMPAAFHYLACAAKAFTTFNEWYAVAGYTRGISDLSIASTKVDFGEIAINALEPRQNTPESGSVTEKAINLVANFRGKYYMWGNRTANTIATDLVASDFLNIRQLCTSLKKQIYITCRSLTFDPNSDILWMNFCDRIRPLLEKMKSDQGIREYAFTREILESLPSEKGKLKARIMIVPIEAVEDFEITVELHDSLDGVTIAE